jgi:hypothetical protein
MAAVDEESFVTRFNLPPKLDEEPPVSGSSYTVRSPYWPKVLPGIAGERPAADDEADYYPDGGFVRAQQGGEDSWIALDLRQRAILNRYVRLGEQSALPAEPGILEVLRAAAASGETVGVAVAGRQLTEAESLKLWQSLDGIPVRPQPEVPDATPVPPPPMLRTGAWLTFTLPEGRDVQLLFVDATAIVVDFRAEQFYPVPQRWLEAIIGPDGNLIEGPSRAQEVPQDENRDSAFWWALMAASGIALLSTAIYLRRRLPQK